MQCAGCGQHNRGSARFCGECGASLNTEITCPACGLSNNSDQRFCDQCDHRLGGESTSEETPPPEPAVPPVLEHAIEKHQPTSISDGRYQAQRFLGEGANKMVYLAQDTLLDRDVAFALIKTDGLDAVSRISHQAQARLRRWDDMLVERKPRDRQKAAAMLDEALKNSTDLGMGLLMARALSKRDILKA